MAGYSSPIITLSTARGRHWLVPSPQVRSRPPGFCRLRSRLHLERYLTEKRSVDTATTAHRVVLVADRRISRHTLCASTFRMCTTSKLSERSVTTACRTRSALNQTSGSRGPAARSRAGAFRRQVQLVHARRHRFQSSLKVPVDHMASSRSNRRWYRGCQGMMSPRQSRLLRRLG